MISAFSMASSGRDFDPRTRAFSDEELKPQPMIKKSRKQVNDVSALIIPSGMLRTALGAAPPPAPLNDAMPLLFLGDLNNSMKEADVTLSGKVNFLVIQM